jgi:hypothetical protein
LGQTDKKVDPWPSLIAVAISEPPNTWLFFLLPQYGSITQPILEIPMNMDDAANKIGKVMGEYKKGKLKSSSGQKVKSRDQAVAIAMSEARSMPKRGSRTATNRSKK